MLPGCPMMLRPGSATGRMRRRVHVADRGSIPHPGKPEIEEDEAVQLPQLPARRHSGPSCVIINLHTTAHGTLFDHFVGPSNHHPRDF